MGDTPDVTQLVARAKQITSAQDKLREAMRQVAAEHANPVPLLPEIPAAPE